MSGVCPNCGSYNHILCGILQLADTNSRWNLVDGRNALWAEALQERYAALGQLVVEELELLRNMEDYFDDRADAEYFTDRAGPVGNEEMGFLVLLRRIIAAADSLATMAGADE